MQIRYLKKEYKVVHNPSLMEGARQLLITVDDGDISFYETAFPVLKSERVSAILFIITSLINTDLPFWWDEINYYLGEQEGKVGIAYAKGISNHERLVYLDRLRKASNKPPLKKRQLTIAQLKEMQAAGIVIANHSHTHPMFDKCTEEELREELQASKEFFVNNGLSGYPIFAYPNGNFNSLAERILMEEGIEQAFLFDHKINSNPINPLRISRLSVNDDTPIWKLKFILSGWHSRMLPITKKLHQLIS